ncbi:MAG: arsenite methyltransferase [Anaerolineae bacterium]|nr:arsenite methyltransferase [Anaerolineae bacterium]
MNSQQIKKNVQEYYGEIAVSGGSCCEPVGQSAPLTFFASPADTAIAEADLGLSCGSPTQVAVIRPGDTVLDLGSGAGVDVLRAAQITGPSGHVIGVDMTPAMIDRANTNAANGGFTNVEFRQGEIEALPVAKDNVDVVLSNCVINLAPDKARVFGEIHRVLKPGGRFAISDIVTDGDVPPAMREDATAWAGCLGGALDREEYLSIMRAAGLVVDGVQAAPWGDSDRSAGYRFVSATVVGRKP